MAAGKRTGLLTVREGDEQRVAIRQSDHEYLGTDDFARMKQPNSEWTVMLESGRPRSPAVSVSECRRYGREQYRTES
jgi:hypothetical protein